MPGTEGNNNNPHGNPATLLPGVAGKETRFGQPGGPDPREAREKQINPTSIRASAHRLMAYPIDTTRDLKEQLDVAKLLEFLAGPTKRAPTLAMLAACRLYAQAQANGKIMVNLIDQIDGKLIEKKVEATVPFSELVKESLQDDLDPQPQG